MSESFTYDDLNRLDTATTLSGAASSTVDYDYDAHGNLTQNRLGALAYAQTNGASLYGVTTAGGNAYGYDAYGNATTLGSRTAQYDVFNKPTRIGNSQFVYSPAHEKVKTVSGVTTTYHYAGGGYLEENTGSGLTTKAYVGGYYLREINAGATTEHYLHFDHLGSVEAISNADGNFISRMSFDAFGNRRNADWTALAAPLPANTFATAWGFTGHDMVDAEGLVHMGGRVYDPALGRFLSADLYVQSPDLSQSYNRYSYTLNNPLSFVDPTGYITTCTRGETTNWICRDDGTLTGEDALRFMRDIELLNSYSQQMTHLVSAWTGAAMQTVANNLDNIQLGLDGFGLIPGIGEFADGANAIISAGRGDWANAGLSAAAMIPLLGNAATAGKIAKNAKEAEVALDAAEDVAKNAGRSGKQARLRELADDDKLGSADRGWIKQEINSIERGQRSNIRNPPGKDLAHERGREAAKGYGYEHSNLQDRDLHRLQHKYDNFGKDNKERPPQ